ncbi:MAG: hypothetical protein D4R67_06780, partial [Bacteroidetes bacterium]
MKTKTHQFAVVTFVLVCFLILFSCKKNSTDEDNIVIYDDDRPLPYQYTDWMANLPDSILLSQITLPGTHDCAADNHSGGVPSGSHWCVVCQDFRFSNQLLLGVRWFDVRYDNVDDRLHHSYFVLSRSLDNIICDARDFLSSHPTETVVFLIKKEYGGSTDGTFSDKVWSIIQKYSSTLFYQDDNLPTLGDVRGKIVIATHDDSNRNGHLLGPNYSWPDNTELFYGYTTSFTYYVQDHFSINHVSYGAKSNEIRALIDISVGYPDPHRVDLNYTSAEKDAEATSIKTVAHNINGNIRDYLLANSEWRRCGALMLNYAGGSDDNLCYPDLVRLI